MPAGTGTAPGVGTGLQAQRLWAPANPATQIASGGSSSSAWPGWLSAFEIGLSGAANGSAQNPACASFAGAGESSQVNCTVVTPGNCGAQVNLFRISEWDCAHSPAAGNGAGQDNDPIYIRATFNRNPTYLGASENILAVVTYAATAFNSGPLSPTSCFTGGAFTPEQCADFTWKAFLKQGPGIVSPQPFMMLTPPFFSYANANPNRAATESQTKQFILPLASDPTLTTFQLSRIKSTLDASSASAFTAACDTGAGPPSPANSPLCAGIIFYSITFYRI